MTTGITQQGMHRTGEIASLRELGFGTWLSAAEAIGERIRQCAQTTSDGCLVWLDPARPRDENGSPVRLGPHLYSGTTGVVLFLAALARITGRSDFRQAALLGLSPLRHQMVYLVGNAAAAGKFKFRLGGTIGLGGYIYSFLRIGGWLDEPELVDEACGIATLVTPERIKADRDLDVLQGSAGALLALLRLDEGVSEAQRRKASPLERAAACGEHLINRRIGRDGQPRGWSTNGYSPWCGFGHGAAGIAYALSRLAERTGREETQRAALEGLAFERLYYDSEQKNWRDLRSTEPRFMTAWCHGATGIALGRLGMLPLTEDPEVPREALAALETTRDATEAKVDFLCCGNMGRVEALLQGSNVLEAPEFYLAAYTIAARVLAQAKLRGGLYRWSENPADERFTPTFFTGAAGIGYAFLRLADLSALPCVLSLE
jgi:type 2 lantibiotic biosynthesis protein LanM